MTKVWNSLFLIFAAVCMLAAPESVPGQTTTVQSRRVTYTDRSGRSVSGIQRVAVALPMTTQAGAKTSTGANGNPPKAKVVSSAARTPAARTRSTANSAVITSNGFGSVAVGSSTTMNLTFSNVSGGLTFSMGVAPDYSIGSSSCDVSCSVTVSFTPQYPGARNSVITATNSSGTVVDETFVYGTGTGPQLGFELGYLTHFWRGFQFSDSASRGSGIGAATGWPILPMPVRSRYTGSTDTTRTLRTT